MSKQPEALRLADMLQMGPEYAAACRTLAGIELRRLHAANAELVEALEHINGFVTGERVPRWDTREHVYASREAIANACGAALSKHKEQGGQKSSAALYAGSEEFLGLLG
jgi:hypothetical protein